MERVKGTECPGVQPSDIRWIGRKTEPDPARIDPDDTAEVFATGDAHTLYRPCVDCGRFTGSYCDYCHAAERIPAEEWADGQMTPLCTWCDGIHRGACHFCRKVHWCRPFEFGPGPDVILAQAEAENDDAEQRSDSRRPA